MCDIPSGDYWVFVGICPDKEEGGDEEGGGGGGGGGEEGGPV